MKGLSPVINRLERLQIRAAPLPRLADDPPTAMDPLVAKVLGNRLAADLPDGNTGKCLLVELETPEICRKEKDPSGTHPRQDLIQKCCVIALHFPKRFNLFAVGKRRRIDHRQIETGVARQTLQEVDCIAANHPLPWTLHPVEREVPCGQSR